MALSLHVANATQFRKLHHGQKQCKATLPLQCGRAYGDLWTQQLEKIALSAMHQTMTSIIHWFTVQEFHCKRMHALLQSNSFLNLVFIAAEALRQKLALERA